PHYNARTSVSYHKPGLNPAVPLQAYVQFPRFSLLRAMLHTIFHTTLIPSFMKARQEGWLRRSRPSSRSSLASDGQVRSWEGAETRLLIPSPDRRHHHCQNNVRRAVREGVLD